MIYPRLGYYGAMRGDGTPLLNPDRTVNGALMDKQSRWHDVILDGYPVAHRPDILTELRARNPAIRLYMYVVLTWWNNPNPALGPKESDLAWRLYDLVVRRTNGALYYNDANGGKPWEHWINIANRETGAQLADLLLEYAGPWDGLFLDITPPRLSFIPSMDFERAGYATWAEFSAAWIEGHRFFAQRLRDGLGDKPMIGNYSQGGEPDLFNGWMKENFPYQNTNDTLDGWWANMIGNPWDEPGYLNEHYRQPSASILVSNPLGGMVQSAQKLRYGLASACLSSGFHTFMRGEWDEPWVRNHLDWWFPEYDMKGWSGGGVGWLGEPLGTAYSMTSGAWRRDFDRGRVYVNPTSEVVRVETPKMHTVFSPVKRAWAIPPGDGLLLASA